MSDAILLLQSQAQTSDIKLDEEGKSTFTIRATARLTGVSAESISKAFTSVNQKPSKLAETLMEQGFESVNLEKWKTDGIPDIAVYHIVYYYAHDAGRYCTEQAKLMAKAFGAMGVRVFSQKALGYTSDKDAIASQSSLTVKLASCEEARTAIASEITIHEKAIEKLRKQYEDIELEIADAYIELYEPIRAKLEYYQEKRIDAMGRGMNPSKSSNEVEIKYPKILPESLPTTEQIVVDNNPLIVVLTKYVKEELPKLAAEQAGNLFIGKSNIITEDSFPERSLSDYLKEKLGLAFNQQQGEIIQALNKLGFSYSKIASNARFTKNI
ncbi:MAG: hypothetical protein V7K64_13550 [Nostoc sp.]|uniref:hypothetical protein n=1 Tax=Nostoc sp. TaxID=1180 RepID=UPI002FF30F3B